MITEIAEVKGRFESIKKPFYGFLILLFLVMPWIKISGSPMILMDIWNRHFVLFGHHFFSHDAPLLFFVIIMTVFIFVLLTALYGRVFCGWACPQTVFFHSVFRRIEYFILGDYLQREKQKKSPMTLGLFVRKSLVVISYLLASYLISHSFIAYFVGAEKIVQFIEEGPANHWLLFIILQISTAILALNFGWFRHRLCHHVCPYGRFQNVLLDNNSLGVLYMKHVGEPRKAKSVPASEQGACVDCHRCVTVCPMKIDIRNGFQLECINCAACIDACDEIMTKIKKPTGLIQFSTADSKPIQYFRFRILLYSGIIAVSFIFFLTLLLEYKPIEFEISRAKQNAFMVSQENGIKNVTNHFEGFIINQKNETQKIVVSLSDKSTQQGYKLMTQLTEIELGPLQKFPIHLFVSKQVNLNEDHRDFEIEIKMQDDVVTKKFSLVGGS